MQQSRLEATRVIYQYNDKNKSIVAYNKDSNTPFLLQSWVEDSNRKLSADFVVTPPLMKLAADKKNAVVMTKVTALPDNVESLYWLNVRFIPSSEQNLENVLRYSVTNQIKLIYRPKGLENVDFSKEVKKINWNVQGDQLIVTNPTPYVINIDSIQVNTQPVENIKYLNPQTDTTFQLKTKASADSKIKFSYINDYGAIIFPEID